MKLSDNFLFFLERQEDYRESILDEPRDHMDEHVWDIDNEYPVMREDVERFIMDGVNHVLSDYEGETNVGYENIFVVGSITGYRYDEKSDIDVTIVVDYEEEIIEELAQRAREINGELLPETEHPVNYFVVDTETGVDRFDSVYEINTQEWIKDPKDYGVDIFSVYDDFRDYIEKIDVDSAEATRTINDIRRLQDAMDGGAKVDIVSQKIEKRIKDLDDKIDELVNEYEDVHKERAEQFKDYETMKTKGLPSPNMMPANVRYKLLERYHYLDLMMNLKKLKEKTGDIDTMQDVDDAEDIISDAECEPANVLSHKSGEE
jgi:hypothetical protein